MLQKPENGVDGMRGVMGEGNRGRSVVQPQADTIKIKSTWSR